MDPMTSHLDEIFGSFPEAVLLLDNGQVIYTNEPGQALLQEDACPQDLLAALAEGKDIWEAARFASGLAALSVQRIGTTPAMPTREEIDAFLAEH